jgi:hypothetical protein
MDLPLHNPDQVHPDQIGEGWRLLTQEELKILPWDAEVWASGAEGWHWKHSTRRGRCGLKGFSYRTRIDGAFERKETA